MTSFDYARSRSTAERLLTKFGMMTKARGPVTMTGPASSRLPGAHPDPVDVRVIVPTQTQRTRDGSSTERDTKTVFVSTETGVEVAPGWEILFGSKWARVAKVSDVAPAGLTIIYRVEVER